jgi:pseudouridine synthase
MDTMRLQKFLSEVGFCSRRDAEGYIKAGKIVVNGKKAVLGDKVTGTESIIVDGKKLQVQKPAKKKVIVFYKPKGVECSLVETPWMKTLMDFDFGSDRVFPIGKLDKDSHGLLLLTNDGELGNRLAHPDAQNEEEYIVTFEENISYEMLTRFKLGVVVHDKQIVPHQVKQLQDNAVRCILHDGRDKLMRKICDAAGLKIRDLCRTRIGTIDLDDLKAGTWKALTEPEYRALKQGGVVRRVRRRIAPGSRSF